MLSKFRINRAALFLGVLGLLTLPREVWGQKRVFAKVEPNADALNSSAEVYNAATGGFSNTPGSLATAREAETANLLPNGSSRSMAAPARRITTARYCRPSIACKIASRSWGVCLHSIKRTALNLTQWTASC